jgi:hypothetical protein
MDRNIYFDTRHADAPENVKFAGGNFEEWKKRGHDQNSMVADPVFVDAAKFNFALKETSPALKLGFQPIDLSGVGVRPKSARGY